MTRPEDPLTERRAAVLRAVVAHYVRTGEPAGSKTLAERFRLGVSPATVRNEMAALEDAGFIYHPHTSAGRIPTDTGYRYYVDEFGSPTRLSPSEAQKVEEFYVEPRWAIEDALRQTALLLANLTHHAAIVFALAADHSVVRQLEVIGLSGNRAMFVMVTDAGRVDNRILVLPEGVTDDDLVRFTELLNRLAAGRPTDQVAPAITAEIEELPPEARLLAKMIVDSLDQGLTEHAEDRFFLEGASHIVDDERFSDLETVRQVIGAFEHRRLLLEVLADALATDTVSVRIGSENEAVEMQSCSVVAAPYGGEGELVGSLGIVGPTRMDYRRTIAAVHEVSAHLGQMLAQLGL